MTDAEFEPTRLRLARELREWSQTDLARSLHVTPTAISQFESGVTRPRHCRDAALRRSPQGAGRVLPPASYPETQGFFRSLRRTSVSHRRRARAIAHRLSFKAGDQLRRLAASQARRRGSIGDTLPVTLTFRHAGQITVDFTITPTGTP